jgi:predicted nucleotidyltransferase
LSANRSEEILLRSLSEILQLKDCVLFTYVFGSFVSAESFRDVDSGIHADTFQVLSENGAFDEEFAKTLTI